MLTLQILALLLIVFLGIPSRIIDYKHRKRNAYPHGNAWAYYSQLSKEGNWEGRFMMWSAYVAIYFVFGVFGHACYTLAR